MKFIEEQRVREERAAQALADFKKQRAAGALTLAEVEGWAVQAVSDFHTYASQNGCYLRDAIALLTELTAIEDTELARVGVSALFSELVERLNDSFDSRACALHDQIMAQVIDFYRRAPNGELIDAALRRFGLRTEAEVLDRRQNLSRPRIPGDLGRVKKAIVFSRVTIGADVAITSIVLRKLRAILPDAEIVLLGPPKLKELFGGDSHLQLRVISYERGGRILDRLTSWLHLLDAVAAESRGLATDEYWVVDTDSRMTQLGLLPIAEDEENYFFFESRCFKAEGAERLGHLTAHWCNKVWSLPEYDRSIFPFVAPPADKLALGRNIAARLKASTLICISLGVGGNNHKRVSEEFEILLMRSLSDISTLIVDKGATMVEREQMERVIAALIAAGKNVVSAKEGEEIDWPTDEKRIDVLAWEGGIGSLAGLIAASDQYLGYDSAGQHIAAALGIPTVTVFVNNSTPIFAARWHPTGPGKIATLTLSPDDIFSLSAATLVERAVKLLDSVKSETSYLTPNKPLL